MAPKAHLIDSLKRSATKSLTFRITVIVSDAIITYLLTHRYDLVLGFVIFTNIASTLLYFLHERFWAHIRWGKK